MMTIVQSPDQLPDDEFTKGMITNTQLLYILPTTDVVYRAVEKRFEMGATPPVQHDAVHPQRLFRGASAFRVLHPLHRRPGEVCGGGAQRTEPGEVPRLPDRRGDMG